MSFLPEKKSLEVLGGKQEERETPEGKIIKFMVEGAGYWDVPDKKEWNFFMNHLLLEYNAAIYIAKKLKDIGLKNDVGELADIDVGEAAAASLLSDVAKRRAREEMNFKKSDIDRHGAIGEEMLKKAGFSENIRRAATSHDFPTSEEYLPTIYDKIALFADLVASQEYTTPEERIDDIEKRWITERKKRGEEPLIGEEIFARYKKVALKISDDIFNLLGETPEEFIKQIPEARETRYLRALYERNLEERGIKFAEKLDRMRSVKKTKD